MWPNARISVMGGKQAALVLTQVMAAQKKREGKEVRVKHDGDDDDDDDDDDGGGGGGSDDEVNDSTV